MKCRGQNTRIHVFFKINDQKCRQIEAVASVQYVFPDVLKKGRAQNLLFKKFE